MVHTCMPLCLFTSHLSLKLRRILNWQFIADPTAVVGYKHANLLHHVLAFWVTVLWVRLCPVLIYCAFIYLLVEAWKQL